MIWYGLQLAIVFYTVHIYRTSIAPEAHLGHEVALGFILAYITTWVISKCLDLFSLLLRLILKLSGLTTAQHTDGLPRLHASRLTHHSPKRVLNP